MITKSITLKKAVRRKVMAKAAIMPLWLLLWSTMAIGGEAGEGPVIDIFGDPQSAKASAAANAMTGSFYFYGKVLDQNNQPVPGVDVVLNAERITSSAGVIGSNSNQATTRTDETGCFSFMGEKGYLFEIKASATGYIVDNYGLTYNYQLRETIKCDKLSNKTNPYIIRAWKLGSILENREITIDHNWKSESVKVGGNKEIFSRIVLDFAGDKSDSGILRQNPKLIRVDVTEDWDLSLSLTGNALDVGMAPFSEEGTKILPANTGIRVKTRNGSVLQADATFPFAAGKEEKFSESIDLKWTQSVKDHEVAYFRIYYHNKIYGYQSFLTIIYRNASQSSEMDGRIGFGRAVPLTVPEIGVLSLSGSSRLEFSSKNIGQTQKNTDERREEQERIIRARAYQEDHLKEIRRTNPILAREIEERMRLSGREVPP